MALSLILSQSRLSFDAFSFAGLACWSLIVLAAHLLFRTSGLYNTVWRFASTPDFFNILKGCGSLTVVLYVTSLGFRFFHPVAGLNERQFIVFSWCPSPSFRRPGFTTAFSATARPGASCAALRATGRSSRRCSSAG
ncbi:hypothetical protein ACVOMV_29165 [Mesorhizobium atlanticum]